MGKYVAYFHVPSAARAKNRTLQNCNRPQTQRSARKIVTRKDKLTLEQAMKAHRGS
jgi:hypothetical protein